jgi:hypothetical protein
MKAALNEALADKQNSLPTTLGTISGAEQKFDPLRVAGADRLCVDRVVPRLLELLVRQQADHRRRVEQVDHRSFSTSCRRPGSSTALQFLALAKCRAMLSAHPTYPGCPS